MKRRPKQEIATRVDEMLSLIEMDDYRDRMPSELSGGQQQRVALARMLATDPRVLLFDEPLSALDRNLRDTLKYSILELQRRTGKTAIYVTHDQSEAFAISDRIFVMNQGRVDQAGTQLDIYLRPQTEFVAGFVGDNNALSGTVVEVNGSADDVRMATVEGPGMRVSAIAGSDIDAGDHVLVFVRPENIDVLPPSDDDPENGVVEGRVDQIVFEGPVVRLVVDINNTPLHVTVSGTERLTLLDKESQTLRLRLGDASLVKQPAG